MRIFNWALNFKQISLNYDYNSIMKNNKYMDNG